MKLAYFSAFNTALSETFIREMLFGLKEKEIDVTHIIGEKENTTNIFPKTIAANFYYKNKDFKYRHKIDLLFRSLFGLNMNLLASYRKKFTRLHMEKVLDSIDCNIAFIDYGTTAVRIYSYLNERNIPYIVHFHGYDASSAFGIESYSEEIVKVFESAAHLIVPSKHMKRLLILKGAPEDKITVIHYAVNFDKVKSHDWTVRHNEGPNITAIGRFVSKKNPFALVHAFKIVLEKLPDAKLNLIGDGPLFSKVKHFLKVNNLEKNIILHGSMPQEKAFEILNKSWCFAQHSVIGINGDQEGFPNSIAEAAAHELPVISTLHSGIPEEVEDTKTGYLVREFDYEMMGIKMLDLLSDFEQCKLLGKAAKKKIELICNKDYKLNKVESLFKDYSKN